MSSRRRKATPAPPVLAPRDDAAWRQQYVENRWLDLGDVSQLRVENPFAGEAGRAMLEDPVASVLDLMRRPENFGFASEVLFNKTLAPFQMAILRELWVRPFPMLIGCRGMGKSFILSVYCMLRALFEQGSKIVVVGAAFRQSKVIFDYCQELWENGPVYRDLVGKDKRNGPRRDVDRCTMRVGDSIIIALPIGDGSKIRGQRANIIIADEFASLNEDIFERVVRGFASVSLSPVKKYQEEMKKKALDELGLRTPAHDRAGADELTSNQTVLSGTAFYSFNHFYKYWKRYKAIIESNGDRRKLAEIYGSEKDIPAGIDPKDYCVMRVPVQMLPPGFMDEKQIAQAKATVHSGTFQMEYGAVFSADSAGFFKRSLIESCVVGKPQAPVLIPSCGSTPVRFTAALKGLATHQYILACDPASERDNLSLVALEPWADHRRVRYCWTTTRRRFKEKLARGLAEEQDFYRYCARQIRRTIAAFPCSAIAIDSQGGGVAIMEALQDESALEPGELPILPVIDPDNPQPTDGRAGMHIIHVISFADANWVSQANHGLRKDMEDKALLFPEFDPAVVALSHEDDKKSGRVQLKEDDLLLEALYDTLEDCVLEIEELKEELASIVLTQTGTGMRDRWDTPEVRGEGGKKGRMRKDRYTALLMANMVARTMHRKPKEREYKAVGGFARALAEGRPAEGRLADDGLWVGGTTGEGAWWAEQMNRQFSTGGYGAVVKRR